MAENIVLAANKENASPFDSIRQYRADGSEFWSARVLMKWLGYVDWRNALKAIARAQKSLENQGHNTREWSLMSTTILAAMDWGLKLLEILNYRGLDVTQWR